MDLGEIGWGGMGLIDLAQDRSSCEYGNESSGSIKFWKLLSSCTTGGSPRRPSSMEI
jgi:hypothetical protein